jgi:formylglycine-generating enzyme required for sulfatase activity
MTRYTLLLCLLLAFILDPAEANFLRIQNVTLLGQDKVNHYTKIQCDIGWDHSWRDDKNWDAAWVFIKYTTDNGATWRHATLGTSPGNHVAPSGSAISPSTDGKGVFVYRSANGSGNNNWIGMQLRWNYGTDGVTDSAIVKVKVLGTEMVYIPAGAFWIGDGNPSGTEYGFRDVSSGNPFRIVSEAAIVLGGSSGGNLGTNGASYDDFTSGVQTLPATFPKGYAAFYVMKHELTQEQYTDMLNTLTRAQQSSRVKTDISSAGATLNRYVMTASPSRGSNRESIRVEDILPEAVLPVSFGCDYSGNGTFEEFNDGQNIPMNFVITADMLAYSDWAGLRPMTELEYEKAARGDQPPVTYELAWGSVFAKPLLGFTDEGTSYESSAFAAANCAMATTAGPSLAVGPVRAGMFATDVSTRESAGAGYFGALELSGSLYEPTVPVSSPAARAFLGSNGDGELSATGEATNSDWSLSYMYRGGGWLSVPSSCRTSKRSTPGNVATRSASTVADGIRCARTAP